jgi:hypothetical protein
MASRYYPARAARGLIGRVIETSPTTAKSWLLSVRKMSSLSSVCPMACRAGQRFGDGTIMIRPVD